MEFGLCALPPYSKYFQMKVMSWMASFVSGSESTRSRPPTPDFPVVLPANLSGPNNLSTPQNGRQHVSAPSTPTETSSLSRQNSLPPAHGQGPTVVTVNRQNTIPRTGQRPVIQNGIIRVRGRSSTPDRIPPGIPPAPVTPPPGYSPSNTMHTVPPSPRAVRRGIKVLPGSPGVGRRPPTPDDSVIQDLSWLEHHSVWTDRQDYKKYLSSLECCMVLTQFLIDYLHILNLVHCTKFPKGKKNFQQRLKSWHVLVLQSRS